MGSLMYSVVIPVYNGEKTIEELSSRLTRLFENINKSFEIVLIDDCSGDNSWQIIREMATKDERIKSIKLVSNFGQHNAILCGMQHSKGNYIITMDDDLQHAPEDIPILINKMKGTGAQVVIAKLKEKKYQWYRRRASDFLRILSVILINKPKGIHLSSFRLINKQVVDKVLSLNSVVPYIPALIFRVTNQVENVEICHYQRKRGNSNYTIFKMFKLSVQLLLNNPVILRFIGNIGSAYVIEKGENISIS
jgi:glycosyltransferase involved in cell wall biosynthesis